MHVKVLGYRFLIFASIGLAAVLFLDIFKPRNKLIGVSAVGWVVAIILFWIIAGIVTVYAVLALRFAFIPALTKQKPCPFFAFPGEWTIVLTAGYVSLAPPRHRLRWPAPSWHGTRGRHPDGSSSPESRRVSCCVSCRGSVETTVGQRQHTIGGKEVAIIVSNRHHRPSAAS